MVDDGEVGEGKGNGRGCRASKRPPLMGRLALISGIEGHSAANLSCSDV